MFVPRCNAVVQPHQLQKLCDFVRAARSLLVLTGAGASTESGIPDYRSEGVGLYARSNHKPVQHQDFVRSAEMRQIYWARNFVGWPHYSSIRPSAVHLTLAKWERERRLHWLVTQNVDGLHHNAGSQRLIELHGASRRVYCLDCSYEMTRDELQSQIRLANPGFDPAAIEMAPDGDVVLTRDQTLSFRVPSCPSCGDGILKPEIVFFGDNVPAERKERVQSVVEESDALLCVGTSLQVFSAYRIILHAKEKGIPIAAVNIGETRADAALKLKINSRAGPVLTEVDRLLS